MTLTRNPTAMMASWNAPRHMRFELLLERASDAFLHRMHGERPWSALAREEQEITESPWLGANAKLNGALVPIPEVKDQSSIRAWIRAAIRKIDSTLPKDAAQLVPLFPEIFPRDIEGCHIECAFDVETGFHVVHLYPERPAEKPWAWADGLGKLEQLSPFSPMPGWNPASERTKEMFPGAVYEKVMGGPGTDFATYDLTILHDRAQQPAWVPMHGTMRMQPCETPEAAAGALKRYWEGLADESRMTAEAYDAKHGEVQRER